MPYTRRGKCVYIKKRGKWTKKGCSKTIKKAKAYLKKLYSVEEIIREEIRRFLKERGAPSDG